ncbi:hypothetical protein GQ42DRAFT_163388 [Ramicandelaber brevisporus]|nr:hypothetical protein GQ42DRAFT_163388 [Ramicandelaber brevisporus]
MAGCLLFHCCVSRQMDKQMSAVAHSQYSYPVDSMPSPSSQQMSEVYAHTSDGHRSGSSTLVRRDSDAEVRARRRTGTASASAAAMAKRPISGSSPLTGPVMLPEHFNSEYEREMHERSLAYERAHPFGSVPTSITDDQQQAILDYGVAAWEMVVDATQATQVSVVERMDVVFNAAAQEPEMEPAAPVTVQSNLPIPRIESTYYFEVKLASLPLGTTVVVGVSTKPYPLWRACGWNKYSIGFFTDTGNVFQDSPFCMLPVGEPCNENDIIGIGYQPNNGTLFFTRNGRRFRTVITGIHYDLFPTVSAVNGPARVSVNVGQVGFVFVEANVKKWGFAALEGAMSPPPAYGDNRGSLLLSSDDVLPIASVSSSEASSTSVQLHLHQPIQLPQHDPERMNALGDLSSSDEQPSPSNSNNLRHSVLVDNPWNLLTPPPPPPPAYPH